MVQRFEPILVDEKMDIVFIGTAIMDTIIKGFDSEPISVTGYRADSASLNIGGEAVNGAIASAKLGMKTGILCHLGEDAAGDIIAWELAKHHVDIGGIVRSKEHPTPITTMFVSDDGSRRSITNTSHRYNFHPEQYSDVYSEAKAVVLGSLFRAPFDDPEVIRSVAEYAHSKGSLVFADTKLPNFTKLSLDDIADSLPFIDYITPNEDEGRYFTGEEEPEKMADVFLKAGARGVVIKLGSKGCYLKDEHHELSLPAYDIEAVDATGAGDNFLAGFVSELIRGSEVEEALRFANACGAICTTAVGAGAALQNREQVVAFSLKASEMANQH